MHYLIHGAAGACTLLAASVMPVSAAEMDPDRGWYFNVEAGPNWAEDADVGFRLGGAVGYNLHKHFGVEFDTGWIWNEAEDADASLSHIPLIVNGVFRYPINSKWVPYAGAGIGGAYSILSIDEFGLDDNDGDFVFAWQFFGGVRYVINDRMSVGAFYKYLGTGDSEFEIDGISFEADDVSNHTVGISFQMKF